MTASLQRSPVFTFAFADIAGFTALTEAHGDEAAADLAQTLADRVQTILPRDADLVKMIGDAAMLRFGDPTQAVRTGLLIVGGLIGEPAAPAIRVGVHTGSAVQRDRDWFGSTVNLAARIAGQARGGETLISAVTKSAMGDIENVELESLGPVTLRNVSAPVELWRARRTDRELIDRITDPVCHMELDRSRAAGSLVYEGASYGFCSLSCAGRFTAHPEQFAREAAGP